MSPPPLQPLVVDRLKTVAGIADIVIAGHRAEPHPQSAHQLSGMLQVRLDLGAVDRDVAGVDDEIGALLGNPAGKRGPIVGEMRLAGAQMRVGDLDYPHGSPRR
jgi:hypothetical protein